MKALIKLLIISTILCGQQNLLSAQEGGVVQSQPNDKKIEIIDQAYSKQSAAAGQEIVNQQNMGSPGLQINTQVLRPVQPTRVAPIEPVYVPPQDQLSVQPKISPNNPPNLIQKGKNQSPNVLLPVNNQMINKPIIATAKGSISLNFDDADVYSVIQTVFGEILKANYIIDPKVKGRVTFRSVTPVPQENVLPVMEVILRLNGVAIVEENSIYRIIPISDLAREPAAINIGKAVENVDVRGKALLQVVPIDYLQSSEIVKLINPFISASAVVVDIPKTNNIIIVDTDANVKRLLQLVNIFDSEKQKKKGPQVFVHHIQNSKAKDIGNLLQQIFLGSKSSGQTVTSVLPAVAPVTTASKHHTPGLAAHGGTDVLVSDLVKIYADEILNAIIITGTPEDYQIIKETITRLDIVPRQVLIEGTIASIQLTDKMSLGLAWSIKNNIFNMDSFTIAMNPNSLNIDTTKANPGGSGLNMIGIDSGGSVRAVINALASQSKAKLLASPHIMVSDNREARIQVGQQVPIPTSETYGTTVGATTVPIRTIQYKDIGIILKVKPQINDSGLVSLQISQEVSTYSTILLYSDEKQIILNKTEATTNLVVQDGQTIVIGGLIREDDSQARSGIPFLSKIPILGYLFGNTDDDASRTELVILLTPHVVKNQTDAAMVTDKFVDKIKNDQINKNAGKGMKIQEETETMGIE